MDLLWELVTPVSSEGISAILKAMSSGALTLDSIILQGLRAIIPVNSLKKSLQSVASCRLPASTLTTGHHVSYNQNQGNNNCGEIPSNYYLQLLIESASYLSRLSARGRMHFAAVMALLKMCGYWEVCSINIKRSFET